MEYNVSPGRTTYWPLVTAGFCWALRSTTVVVLREVEEQAASREQTAMATTAWPRPLIQFR